MVENAWEGSSILGLVSSEVVSSNLFDACVQLPHHLPRTCCSVYVLFSTGGQGCTSRLGVGQFRRSQTPLVICNWMEHSPRFSLKPLGRSVVPSVSRKRYDPQLCRAGVQRWGSLPLVITVASLLLLGQICDHSFRWRLLDLPLQQNCADGLLRRKPPRGGCSRCMSRLEFFLVSRVCTVSDACITSPGWCLFCSFICTAYLSVFFEHHFSLVCRTPGLRHHLG